MRFIVDAQLPRSLANFLNAKGYDTIHTLDLPNRNASDDNEISKLSLAEKRIVISKDSDFYDSFFRKLEPYKLLYLTTGNIHNLVLLEIFAKNLEVILAQLETNFVVEVSQTSIITID